MLSGASMGISNRSKHTVFYDLLDALRQTDRCPLCVVEAGCVTRFLEHLFHEGVNDPGAREALRRSGGFCPRHAHVLRNSGDALGVSILCQDQVRLFLSSLDDARDAKRTSRRRTERGDRAADCPACRVQQECRQRHINALIDWIDDPDVQEALRAGNGCCFRHLPAVLDAAKDPAALKLLLDVQRAAVGTLLRDLEEFQRKHDYRFSGERYGSESDSWSRAIRAIAGEPGLF